jgi:ABC-type antimicrobial peptide transport system permease subunit
LSSQIRELVRARDPHGLSYGAATMESLLAAQLAPRRYAASALAAFGVLAIVLAFIGVYATVSHVMAGRRREIAVRMPVGATPREMLRLAITDAFRYTTPGLILGAAIGVAASRLMNRLLFGIGGVDALTLTAVGFGVSVVVVLASLVPALRAARLDPRRF